MTFLWTGMLWFLLAAPLLVRGYMNLLRRRKKVAARYSHLAAIKQSLDGRATIKRHIPPALLLVSFCLLIVASARPSAVMTLTSTHGGTIVMAMDVSGSMRTPDVAPDRITAARVAAKAFVDERDRQIRIAIVGFSSEAFLVQAPTADTHMLDLAIDSLQPQLTTAIGSAVVTSLQTIFPRAKLGGLVPAFGGFTSGEPLGDKPPAPPPPPVPPGSYRLAAIVLMTDGRNTAGPDPVEAARSASNLGVRIFTIGFGNLAHPPGTDITTIVDEPTLRKMADMTRGQYFHAQTADELTRIYKQLTVTVTKGPEETEITVVFAAAAAAFCVLSALLSMLWYHRLF
jgi:Ca-activated chloride channel family protein